MCIRDSITITQCAIKVNGELGGLDKGRAGSAATRRWLGVPTRLGGVTCGCRGRPPGGNGRLRSRVVGFDFPRVLLAAPMAAAVTTTNVPPCPAHHGDAARFRLRAEGGGRRRDRGWAGERPSVAEQALHEAHRS